MLHGRIIYILGDVHGAFGALNHFIRARIRKNRTLQALAARWKAAGDDLQVMILQCGDFAYFWPRYDNRGAILNNVKFLHGGRVPIYWTGNHEDWDELEMLGPEIAEIDRGLFYCPFGSTLALAPEITVLFAGGAESADKKWRLERMTKRPGKKIWWEQEGISEQELARLDLVPKADWVISHTAPESFDLATPMRTFLGGKLHDEPSRLILERVFSQYRPQKWFFGHYHHHMSGFTDGCNWECLANLDGPEPAWTRIYLEWRD